MSGIYNPSSLNREQELAFKAKALKQISIDINENVNESNFLMDDMHQDMGNVQGMFNQAQLKLTRLLKHGGMKMYCYLICFVVFIIVVLVIIVRSLKS